ncbi:YppE family protein [Mesobacillus subterraneus]|uniref:YppE family protein n=1 Tax=Mesobacillus subterraneus TaxID=285983 RepID=UPI00203D925E|nr:YppE family protein [Mesobacillus subterraneus]MCM3571624.1 YppE family protein [Mesobacillus subterraneus]
MELENSILTLSRQLLVNVDTAHRRFQYSKEKGVRGDFHSEVKPFADEVKLAADAWRESAANWVKNNRPKNLHANQIETAADYLEVISVQAFFPETSKKRFLDQVQSVEFILNSMIIAIEQSAGQPGS